MDDPQAQAAHLASIALFPLPNVVLLPRAVLPLHIFEERYCAMMADVLDTGGHMAMALLKPGWEKDYYGRPDIEPVVCVGSILSHERVADGTYNLLLQGRTRARIVREHGHGVYRRADLERISETPAPPEELKKLREQLIRSFDGGSLLTTVIGRQFRQLLMSDLTTADVADLIAFNFLADNMLKQALLADGDILRRVSTAVRAFEMVRPTLEPRPPSPPRPSLN